MRGYLADLTIGLWHLLTCRHCRYAGGSCWRHQR